MEIKLSGMWRQHDILFDQEGCKYKYNFITRAICHNVYWVKNIKIMLCVLYHVLINLIESLCIYYVINMLHVIFLVTFCFSSFGKASHVPVLMPCLFILENSFPIICNDRYIIILYQNITNYYVTHIITWLQTPC